MWVISYFPQLSKYCVNKERKKTIVGRTLFAFNLIFNAPVCDVCLDWSFRCAFLYGQSTEATVLQASGSWTLGCERAETISADLLRSRVAPAHLNPVVAWLEFTEKRCAGKTVWCIHNNDDYGHEKNHLLWTIWFLENQYSTKRQQRWHMLSSIWEYWSGA